MATIYFIDGICLYVFQDHETSIKAIYTGSEFIESAASGNEVGIVLESTSFYAEQGGQVQFSFFPLIRGFTQTSPFFL